MLGAFTAITPLNRPEDQECTYAFDDKSGGEGGGCDW